MASAQDKAVALIAMDTLIESDGHEHYVTLLDLIGKYSIQWLVDVLQEARPGIMAISVPGMLAGCVALKEPESPSSLQGQTWESVKTAICALVNGHLR